MSGGALTVSRMSNVVGPSPAVHHPLLKDPVSGLTHLAGCLLGAFGAVFLVVRGDAHGAMLAAQVIYGLCLTALYAASATYHLVDAPEGWTRRLRLLDHAAIFFLVAGTCTPIFLRAFAGRERIIMLCAIWSVAFLGVAFKLLWRGAPRLLYTAVYLAMGWGVVMRWPTVAAALPRATLLLVVAGGATYSLGALVYSFKRPDPFPRVFGFHEIWHLFVLAGSTFHYAAVASLA